MNPAYSICAVLCASLAWAPAALPQEAAETVRRLRPPLSPYLPLEAVDHVAELLVTPVGGPPRNEAVIVARSGSWQREERTSARARVVEFANHDLGVSATWVAWADGSETFTASQSVLSDGYYVRQPTTERQTWVGESCNVWLWQREPVAPGSGQTLSCVTADGIELWRGYRDLKGQVTERFHAVAIERRSVSADEVQPPASLLDWDYWAAGADVGDADSGHEIMLGGDMGELVISRRRGEWGARRHQDPHRGTTVSASSARAGFTFSDGGRGKRLNIWRDRPTESIGGPPVAFDPPRVETILDRQCIWYNMTPNIYDASESACRDPDGVTLATYSMAWGARDQNLRAFWIDENPPSVVHFVLPADATTWIGVEPVP